MVEPEPDPTLPAPARTAGGTALAIGEQAGGRYRIVAYIASGAMGEVYAAEDLVVGGQVAIKVLRPELAESATAVERLRREIGLARTVTNAHVCRAYDVGEHAGRVFLTMELLAGTTLAARVKSTGALPIEDVERFAADIVDGLAALHRAGVIHRDLKTANVIVVGDGRDARAVITDFGLARSIRPDRDASLTAEASLLGTPAYMAPEQVEGRDTTAATDVFALGVVLFELLTGELPFRGDTALATATARLHKDAPRPSSIRPELPPRWDTIVGRCLARDPASRPGRVDDVLASPTPRRSRRGLLAAAIGAATVAVIAWATAGGTRDPSEAATATTRGAGTPVDDLVAVLPVAGDGELMSDPLRLAFTLDLHDELTSAGAPVLSVAAGGFSGYLGGTAMILAREPDPVAAALALPRVTAVVTMTFAEVSSLTVGVEVVITRAPRTELRLRLARPSSEIMLLVHDVAVAITSEIGRAAPAHPRDAFAVAPEVYRDYGEALIAVYTADRELLTAFVDAHPDLARAGARLADRLVTDATVDEDGDSTPLLEAAIATADRAIAADPRRSLARAARGSAAAMMWDWTTAEAELARAAELAPTDERVAFHHSQLKKTLGWFEDELPVDGLNPLSPMADVGRASRLYYSRRYKEAVEFLEPRLASADLSDYLNAYMATLLAPSYAELARFDDAVALADRVRAVNPDLYLASGLVPVYVVGGRRADARAIQAQVGDSAGSMVTAVMHDYLGEHDAALTALERVVDDHNAGATMLKVERFTPVLRSDPRFQALLRRVGLPP